MNDSSTFRTVLRGYEPAQVDKKIRELTEAAHSGRDEVEQLRRRVAELEQAVAQTRRRAEEDVTAAHAAGAAEPAAPVEPTFELLGSRVGKILALAEEEAAELRHAAQGDADAHRQLAEQAAAQVRAEADRYASERKSAADAEAERVLEGARRTADDLLDAADRDATARREEAEAVYEHQRARAAQAAADFETTLAQRRERAEHDFTTRTAAAEQQLAAVQERAEQVRAEADRAQIEAERAAQRLLADAGQQAQEIVAAAKARADKIRAESDRELAAASQRRDSINAQLTNVRQMLATLSGTAAPALAFPEEPAQRHSDTEAAETPDGEQAIDVREPADETGAADDERDLEDSDLEDDEELADELADELAGAEEADEELADRAGTPQR
jgi:cell division septum initiation protein DivIVA